MHPFYLLGLRLSSKFTNPKCLLRHTVSDNLKGMYRLNHILEVYFACCWGYRAE